MEELKSLGDQTAIKEVTELCGLQRKDEFHVPAVASVSITRLTEE